MPNTWDHHNSNHDQNIIPVKIISLSDTHFLDAIKIRFFSS